MFSIPVRSSVPCSPAKGSIRTDSWRVWGGRPSTFRLTQLDLDTWNFFGPCLGLIGLGLFAEFFWCYGNNAWLQRLLYLSTGSEAEMSGITSTNHPSTQEEVQLCETWNSKPKKGKHCLMFQYTLASLKLSYPLKIGLPNRKLGNVIFQPSIFRGYVSFREGRLLKSTMQLKHQVPQKKSLSLGPSPLDPPTC